MQTINGNAWLVSLKHNAIRILSIVMLISWAVLLTTHTILLQHSCTPLLEWTDISARDCSTNPSSKPSPELEKPLKNPSNKPKPPNSHPIEGNKPKDVEVDHEPDSGKGVKEIASVAAGSIAAVGLAVIEAPVLVVAGVGFFVWLAARTLLSSGK